MTAREKIDAALDYLDARGVGPQVAAPFHYSILWRCGLCVPPPHFQSFFGLLLLNSLFWGTVFALMARAFERHHSPVQLMLVFGLVGGFSTGFFFACLYRFKAWRLGLPVWADFPPTRAGTDDEADIGW